MQHLASLHEGILFQASEADGVLDDSTIKPSWSGSNWTYRIPFLDKKSANDFVTFLERDLATDLSEQEGLSCANVQPSEGGCSGLVALHHKIVDFMVPMGLQ